MSTLKSLVADYNANSWWTTYKTIDDLPCSVDLLWAITNYKSGTSLPINHWVAPFFRSYNRAESVGVMGADNVVLNNMNDSTRYLKWRGSGTPMWIEGSEVYSDSNSRRVVINSSGSRFKSGTHAAAARPINE